MAEMVVRVESSEFTPLITTTALSQTEAYTTLIHDAPGVALANNFLSVFNPVGSGKTLIFVQFVAFAYSTGAATATDNMLIFRTTAASGGTLVPASEINKLSTSTANSVAEVRTGNPTTTNLARPFIAVPPMISTGGQGATGNSINIVPGGVPFLVEPGEGVVMRTAAGDVDQRWTLGTMWSEI